MARGIPRGFTASAFKHARLAAGLSVTALARKSGVGISTITAWEAGRPPQIDVLRKALRVLDIAPEAVINVDPSKRTLGDWRALRLLLQPELARRIEIGTPHLSLIESAAMELTPGVRRRLAIALEIPEDEVSASWQRRRDMDR